ncbi:MAG: thiamine-phosphate kinase [Candidatus Bathyarchaeia archaeon]
MTTAEKLGEHKIIETIWKHLDKAPHMLVPFGDDVSAIKYSGDDLVVVKTDMLVGKTDMPPQMNYWQAARKAVVMNVSDLAAKGVKPLGLLVSLGVPRNLTKKDIRQIGKGLNAGAREYDTYVLGGDTSETQDLIVSVAVFGLTKKENLILRSGARPGDIVATTGLFGLTSSGFKILIQKLTAPTKIRKKLVNSVLMPHAKLEEGLALAKTGATTASIDSSDGLAWSLYEISRASNVGFVIDAPPVASEAYEFAKLHNLDPLNLSFYGGEEYELVVTVNPKHWRKVKRAVMQKGGSLMKIGKATAKKDIFLEQEGELVKIEARGYEHFKHKGSD